MLPAPTKEHFCQNPWVGEALSLCHVAGYCINHPRLQSLTVHVIETFRFLSILSVYPTLFCSDDTSRKRAPFVYTKIFFFPRFETGAVLLKTLVLSGQGRVLSFCFRNDRDSQTRAHRQHKPQSFKSTGLGEMTKFSKILPEGQQTLLAAQQPELRGSEPNKNPSAN